MRTTDFSARSLALRTALSASPFDCGNSGLRMDGQSPTAWQSLWNASILSGIERWGRGVCHGLRNVFSVWWSKLICHRGNQFHTTLSISQRAVGSACHTIHTCPWPLWIVVDQPLDVQQLSSCGSSLSWPANPLALCSAASRPRWPLYTDQPNIKSTQWLWCGVQRLVWENIMLAMIDCLSENTVHHSLLWGAWGWVAADLCWTLSTTTLKPQDTFDVAADLSIYTL